MRRQSAFGARSGAFPQPHRGRFTLRDAHGEVKRGAESAASGMTPGVNFIVYGMSH
jgi:hypothetical protein